MLVQIGLSSLFSGQVFWQNGDQDSKDLFCHSLTHIVGRFLVEAKHYKSSDAHQLGPWIRAFLVATLLKLVEYYVN